MVYFLYSVFFANLMFVFLHFTSVQYLVIFKLMYDSERDLFIEEHMKPKNRVISDSNLEWLFDLDDGHMV